MLRMATNQFSIETVSPAYWCVTFSNAPVNLIDADTIDELAALLDRAAGDPELTPTSTTSCG
jgi:enoyl-CoA hydratase/carnithine racemase